jgi:probable rRNA maturation factor
MTGDPDHSTGTATIAIAVEADDWGGALPDCEALIEAAARAALAGTCPELPANTIVSVLLADDATLRELNRVWRGQDKPTNVLSFPATETRAGAVPERDFAGVPLELGDIALAFETCRQEAQVLSKPLADHVAHLAVHGVLHLLGYDHIEDADAAVMMNLETVVLARLGIPDPYLSGDTVDG